MCFILSDFGSRRRPIRAALHGVPRTSHQFSGCILRPSEVELIGDTVVDGTSLLATTYYNERHVKCLKTGQLAKLQGLRQPRFQLANKAPACPAFFKPWDLITLDSLPNSPIPCSRNPLQNIDLRIGRTAQEPLSKIHGRQRTRQLGAKLSNYHSPSVCTRISISILTHDRSRL